MLLSCQLLHAAVASGLVAGRFFRLPQVTCLETPFEVALHLSKVWLCWPRNKEPWIRMPLKLPSLFSSLLRPCIHMFCSILLLVTPSLPALAKATYARIRELQAEMGPDSGMVPGTPSPLGMPGS